MRAVPIIVLAAAAGVALGAGVSWLRQPAAALPAPLHGKGPRFLVEPPPADAATRQGSWRSDEAAAAANAPPAEPAPANASAPADASAPDDHAAACPADASGCEHPADPH